MEKYRKNISILKPFAYIVVCICFSLYGCSPQSLHEAQAVVCAADSLRAEGQLYSDSMRLAKAYETLNSWQLVYPDAYAHACYHYGRLLRSQDNPVAAMQVFIKGAKAQYLYKPIPHPSFTAYSILGRIYSNMGAMCHLVDSFHIAYQMYEKCAEQFRKANDSTMYFYALNAMAFESAEQKNHDKTLSLLLKIEQECSYSDIHVKTLETKAILYNRLEQYDLVLYYVNQMQSHGNVTATGYVSKAQAFYYLHQIDSALYYAKQVMTLPDASYQDKYNMLYILTYHNPSIKDDEIKSLSDERADLDRYIINPSLQKLSVATALLEQDINTKKPYLSLGILLLLICLVSGFSWMIKHQYNARHKQIKEQLVLLSKQKEERRLHMLQEIENNCEALHYSHDWKNELHWNNYDELCEIINKHFYLLASKLRQMNILNETEIRLCVLVLIDYSRNEIAAILPYAANGVGKFKYRVAQKLGTEGKNLRKYLISMAINGRSESQ